MRKHLVGYILLTAAIPLAYYAGLHRSANREPTKASGPDLSSSPASGLKPSPASTKESTVAQAPASTGGNPRQKLEALLASPASPERDRQLAEIFHALGRDQKAGAFEHLGALQGHARDLAISSILMGWATVEPRAAWTRAVDDALQSGFEWTDSASAAGSGKLFMLLTSIFRNGDRAELPGLINELPMGRGKDSLVGMYTKLLTMYDRAEVMKYIGTLEGETRVGALRNVAQDLAKEAPEETANWILTLQGEEGLRTIKPVMSEWLERDSSGAAGWIKQQKPSAVVDGAIDFFISEASLEILKVNSDLLERYSSEKSRERGQSRLSRRITALSNRLETQPNR